MEMSGESPRCLSVPQFQSFLSPLACPPERLFLWGELPPGPYVALVGRREPSPEGYQAAERLAYDLGKAGLTVISGGARGIDTAAHRGALRAGGRTVVVAPVWWQEAYPLENRGLFREILEAGGGYLCAAEEGTPPLQPAFFRRNALLASLAAALIVGECGFRSGARNAASHAEKMGCLRYVLPSAYGSSGVGNMDLLTRGWTPLVQLRPLLKSLAARASWENPEFWDSLAEERSQGWGLSPKKRGRRVKRSADERVAEKLRGAELSGLLPEQNSAAAEQGELVLQAVREGAVLLEQICEKTGLAAPVVQHLVLLFTLSGELREDEQGLLRYHP